jgi:rhamnopyranosyl-N-acetylglucosaminyl-diphospho-decaprenol beta-1,3/1,4-galactofuranosyltransferase
MSVCAVVVTYNRSATLRHCLTGMAGQTRQPDGLLVVDNASTDDTPEVLAKEFPSAHVLRLAENMGGGGGFEAGMREAVRLGYDWAWLTDDDPVPEDIALETIMAEADAWGVESPVIFSSVQYDKELDKYNAGFYWRGVPVPVPRSVVDEGAPYAADLAPFCGFLAGRALADAIGYPPGHFFMRFTDYEYSLRARTAGILVFIVPRSRMLHPLGERSTRGHVISRNPPWKAYYDSRNRVYTALRTRKNTHELLLALRFSAVQSARELVVNPRFGLPNTAMRVRGVWDGLTGRMGKTVDPARTRVVRS